MWKHNFEKFNNLKNYPHIFYPSNRYYIDRAIWQIVYTDILLLLPTKTRTGKFFKKFQKKFGQPKEPVLLKITGYNRLYIPCIRLYPVIYPLYPVISGYISPVSSLCAFLTRSTSLCANPCSLSNQRTIFTVDRSIWHPDRASYTTECGDPVNTQLALLSSVSMG